MTKACRGEVPVAPLIIEDRLLVTPLLFLLRSTPSLFGVVGLVVVFIMNGITGDHQRSRRTPLVIPPIDLEVHSADVDGVES